MIKLNLTLEMWQGDPNLNDKIQISDFQSVDDCCVNV